MRISFHIIFLLLFLLEAIGAHFFFFINKSALRHDSKNVPKEKLCLIVVSKKEKLTQTSVLYKDEFIYKGAYYDVLSRHQTKDSIYLYCYIDEKEKELKNRYDQLLSIGNHKKNNNNKQLDHILKNLFKQYYTTTFFYHSYLYVKNSKSNHSIYTPSILFISQEIDTPPPRL